MQPQTFELIWFLPTFHNPSSKFSWLKVKVSFSFTKAHRVHWTMRGTSRVSSYNVNNAQRLKKVCSMYWKGILGGVVGLFAAYWVLSGLWSLTGHLASCQSWIDEIPEGSFLKSLPPSWFSEGMIYGHNCNHVWTFWVNQKKVVKITDCTTNRESQNNHVGLWFLSYRVTMKTLWLQLLLRKYPAIHVRQGLCKSKNLCWNHGRTVPRLEPEWSWLDGNLSSA